MLTSVNIQERRRHCGISKGLHEGILNNPVIVIFVATAPVNLKRRKNIFMKDIEINPCDQCEYMGSQPALYVSKKSKHAKIKYYCDQCSYAAVWQFELKQHKDFNMKGSYSHVILCDFNASDLTALRDTRD